MCVSLLQRFLCCFLSLYLLSSSLLSAQSSPAQQEINRLIEQNQLETAFQKAQQLQQKAIQSNDYKIHVWSLQQIAFLQGLNEEPQLAFENLDLAEQLAQQHLNKSDTLQGQISQTRAEINLGIGELDLARSGFLKAIQRLELSNKWDDIALCYNGLAICDFIEEDWIAMKAPLEKAAQVAQQYLPFSDEAHQINASLFALHYDATGDSDEAMRYSEIALASRLEKGLINCEDSIDYALELNNLGTVYSTVGDYQRANQLFRQSYSIESSCDTPEEELATTSLNIIYSYMRQSQWQAANYHIQKVEQQLFSTQTFEYTDNHITLLNHKAFVQKETKAFSAALETIARSIAHSTPFPALQRTAYFLQAEAFYETKQFEQCLSALQQIPRNENFRATENSFHLQLSARANAMLGRFDLAKQLLSELQDFLLPAGPNTEPPMPLELLKYRWAKAEILSVEASQSDQPTILRKQAEEQYRLASQLLDRIHEGYSEKDSKQYLLSQARGNFEKALDNALHLFQLTQNQQYLHQAFDYTDQAKTVLLEKRIQSTRKRKLLNLPDSIQQRETLLKRRLIYYQQKQYEAQLQGSNLSLQLSTWEEKIRAIKKELRDISEQVAALGPRQNPSSSAHQQLPSNTIVINYFWGEKALFILQKTDQKISANRIIIDEPFVEQIIDFIQYLRSPEKTEIAYQTFLKSGHALFQQLMPNLPERANTEQTPGQLLLIPDGPLYQLPFDVLLTQHKSMDQIRFDQLPYLLRTYAIYYAYSSQLTQTSHQSSNTSLQCLAMAPSYANNTSEKVSSKGAFQELRSLYKLPGAQKEVAAIAEYLSGKYYFGEEATEALFKKQAAQFNVIHLAMHAAANVESPLFGQMYFSKTNATDENDTLFSHELRNINLQAKLAVLSACETGLGRAVDGNGSVSIASHFLEAGCESVTMSLWEAQDFSTSQIMQLYYQGLAQGLPKSAALREAKLSYLNNPYHQQHPFFWAGFVHLGPDQGLVEAGFSAKWAGIATIAIGFILLLFFAFRQKNKWLAQRQTT